MADKKIINLPSIGLTGVLPNVGNEEPKPQSEDHHSVDPMSIPSIGLTGALPKLDLIASASAAPTKEEASDSAETSQVAEEASAKVDSTSESTSADEAPASEETPLEVPSEAPKEEPPDVDSAQPEATDDSAAKEALKKSNLSSEKAVGVVPVTGPKHSAVPEKPAKEKKPHSFLKIAAVFLLVVVGLALCAWGAGFFYYTKHLLPHSFCSGRDLSGLTISEAQELTSTANWKLRVVEGDNEWILSSEDVGLTLSEINYDQVIKDQNAASWPLSYIGSEDSVRNDIAQQVTYDPEAVAAAVAALPCVTDGSRVPQSDAYAELSEDGRKYVVHNEALGSKVDVARVVAAITAELDTYCVERDDAQGALPLVDGVPTLDLVAVNAYEQPAVTRDDPSLTEAINTANRWLSTRIVYDIDGIDSAEMLDAATISGWVTVDRIDEVDENGTVKVSFNAVYHDDLVRDWLSDMGEKYDTVFNGKTITTADGSSRYVTGGNSYGWITDEATEFDLLTADVAEGRTVHRAFATKQQGSVPQAKFEGRYVEVNIEDQHIWLFDNGSVIWDARTVTGSPSHPTVTGTFQIYKMERNTVLVGTDEDKDGKPDYESPVSYWMPFCGGYGLHDATGWRGDDPSNYGGGVRYYNGSHGCCNLTGPDAEYLYSMAFVGMTVYVH